MVEVENAAPRRRRFRATALFACAAAVAAAAASPAPAAEQTKQVYDVRDLLVEVPDFVDAPSLGLGGPRPDTRPAAEPAPVKQATRDKALTDWLIAAIRRPDADAPAAAVLDGRLTLAADADAHAAAAALLKRLIADRTAMVTIEVRHLAFDADLKRVDDERLRERLALATSPDRPAVPLDELAATRLLRLVAVDPKATAVSAPRVTLFNGQRAYVTVATQRAYVAGIEEVKGKDGKPAFDPRVDIIESGVMLDARATIEADRRAVALDLRYEHVRLLGMRAAERKASDGTAVNVQTPVTAETRLRRVLSLAPGATALVYLGRAEPAPADLPPQPPPAPGKGAGAGMTGDMFLLVKVTTLEGQRAVDQRQFPLLKTTVGE